MTHRSLPHTTRASKAIVRQGVADGEDIMPREERDDLRKQARLYGGVSEHAVDRLCDVIDAFEKRVEDLVEAADQCLDDMGAKGQSVCGHAKASLRFAIEPFLGQERLTDEPLAYSFEDALRILVSVDESHGKPSPLRKLLPGPPRPIARTEET